ncbi:MAG: molybdopterin-dependent oxidoreductase [Pyrinomonadaceae bacterium]|jgi:DMSO/TMAO reductase YedYZ molybdopterin-dependent catalytic subunit
MSKTDGEREMGKGQTTDAREMKAADASDANAAATDGQNQLIGNETENTARIVGEARRLSPVMGDDETRREMTRRSRRGFLVGGVAAIAAFGGWRWLKSSADADGIPYPLRRAHEFNEQLSRTYFGRERLTQTFPPAPTRIPRVNGDIGLSGDFDLATWQLRVTGLPGDASELRLTLDDIRALPRVELTTELKCIEGWSDLGHWAGTRFADFAARYVPTTRSGYVSLETPDGGYYVGLDIESALHPQTLLCYEMGGQPLTPEHGAPLRLYIPVKYGIKSLKRIGTIRFTNERPADFWAERGYDWYSGH